MSEPTAGFVVDAFAGERGGKPVVFLVGRLVNGETFAVADDRAAPGIFIRISELARAEEALRARTARPMVERETGLTTMDGERVARLRAGDGRAAPHVAAALAAAGVRTYGGDQDAALAHLARHGVRGSLALAGPWRPSPHVGRVYLNPEIQAADAEVSLKVLALDIETDVAAGNRVLAVSLVTFWIGAEAVARGETEEVLILEGEATRGVAGEMPGGAAARAGPGALDDLPRAAVPMRAGEAPPSAAADEALGAAPAGGAAPAEPPGLSTYPDERTLLAAFARRVKELDPDIVTGWNILDFDLPHLARRSAAQRLPWDLGRTRDGAWAGRGLAPLPGRQALDAMRLVRSALLSFDDLRLSTVAKALLGRGKTIEIEEWEDTPERLLAAYRADRTAFAAYCLEDSRLVRDILRQEQLLELTVSRTRLIGLPLAKSWGSVASFEHIYMAELGRRRIVAPSRGVDQPPSRDGSGGLVLEPVTGLHKDVMVFDFRSLYPSIIRTFNIDPLAHARAAEDALIAPNGAAFARPRGILPETLDRFFDSRAEAQKRGDQSAAYAYKIIMNSFYGVLGTDTCRFASPALAGAITGFGHELLLWTKAHFESRGFRVLYGDTDSLFVEGRTSASGAALAAEVTAALAVHLREAYGVASRLELKFEKLYRRMLLPQARAGSGAGRAKSYAGLKAGGAGDALEITGMEAVRRDWTPLARQLQRELLGLLFAGAPASTLEARVRAVVREVAGGRRDAELVYRKSIRKPLSAYTSTTPPHVKAARRLPRAPRVVRYLMTLAGPAPLGYVDAPIDHAHYVAKQVLPIVEPLAELVGFDAQAACRLPGEGGLFGD